jgi:hypothetical protein
MFQLYVKVFTRISAWGLSDLKKQTDKQENRLWVLISGMFLFIAGALTKYAFFPNP